MQEISIKYFFLTYSPRALRPWLDRLESSPVGYRIIRGSFWLLVGTVISRGLMLVSFVIVARMFGKVVFGELGIVQSTVEMFGVFAGFGLGMTSTKHIAEFKEKDPAKAGRIMALSNFVAIITGVLMVLALVALSPLLSSKFLAAPHLSSELRIGALILFFGAINGVQTGALAGFEAFKTIALVNLLAGISAFPLIVSGAYFGGLRGAIWGIFSSQAVNWFLNHRALYKKTRKEKVPFLLTGCRQEWKILWNFSLPTMLVSMTFGPVNWGCNAMLVNQPNGYAEMGIFNAANQWFSALMFLPLILGRAILPILSERLGVNDKKKSRKTVTLSLKVNTLIVIPLVVGICIASPFIMRLYGESFEDAWKTLGIVALSAGLAAIQGPVSQILWASSKVWRILMINTSWGLVFLFLTGLWAASGSIGLASARFVAYIASLIFICCNAYFVLLDRVEPK